MRSSLSQVLQGLEHAYLPVNWRKEGSQQSRAERRQGGAEKRADRRGGRGEEGGREDRTQRGQGMQAEREEGDAGQGTQGTQAGKQPASTAGHKAEREGKRGEQGSAKGVGAPCKRVSALNVAPQQPCRFIPACSYASLRVSCSVQPRPHPASCIPRQQPPE